MIKHHSLKYGSPYFASDMWWPSRRVSLAVFQASRVKLELYCSACLLWVRITSTHCRLLYCVTHVGGAYLYYTSVVQLDMGDFSSSELVQESTFAAFALFVVGAP
jgi:hypothetical protein